jgi:hypothetical protein
VTAHTLPTRRELLAGTTVAAVMAPAVALVAPDGALGSDTSDTSGSETDRLARLIRIELLLLYCYENVLAGPLLGPRTRATIAPFVAHEQAHIAALGAQLRARGGSVPLGPADVRAANHDLAHRRIGGRLGELRGDHDAVRMLLTLEQTTIGAYFVALTKLADPDLVELICQIMANDAQHDAMLGIVLPPGTPASAVPYGLVQGLQGP